MPKTTPILKLCNLKHYVKTLVTGNFITLIFKKNIYNNNKIYKI